MTHHPPQKTKTTLKDVLLVYLKAAQRHWFLGSLALFGYFLGQVAAEVVFPVVLGKIIDVMNQFGATEEAWAMISRYFWWLVGLAVVYQIGYRMADIAMTYFQTRVLRNLAEDAFTKLHKKSYRFFSGEFTGGLVAKVRRYVDGFEIVHDRFTFTFWFVGAQIIGILVAMVIKFKWLATGFAVWIILYTITVYFYVRWKSKYDKLAAETDSEINAITADSITNILAIKTFVQEASEKRRFFRATAKRERALRFSWNLSNLQYLVQGILMDVMILILLWMLFVYWKEGRMSIGEIVMIQAWILGLTISMWDISRGILETGKAVSEAIEMVDILENAEEIRDPKKPLACKIRKGEIEFSNVNFQYEGTHEAIFNDLNLKVHSGERVGIVGHSGAGKSTLVKLILRFANLKNGQITIDGQNISFLTKNDLRSHITYVPQEPLLFHRTIGENINYGAPDKSERQIEAATKKAHAHDFIQKLPKTYDTLVGERGVKLSGGERQRVAIARAMLKESPILILDEATSSLDTVSERYIQEAFEELMKGKTTMVIAHRLSTIQKMDRIIVLSDGEITEDGTHDVLLKKNGIYARLWETQHEGFLGE